MDPLEGWRTQRLRDHARALAHFEWVHLENIERSALEESKITRQTVRYEVGEILNGQLKDGKVKYATTVTESRPPAWFARETESVPPKPSDS